MVIWRLSGHICFFFFLHAVSSVPPTNLSCVSVNPSTIHCTWKPPPVNSRNGKITGYTIRHKTTNQRHSHDEVGGSVQSRTIGGLQAYTTYDVDVAAKTRLGQGLFTDPVKVTTKETSE